MSNRIFFDEISAKNIEIDENYAIKIAVRLREYDHDLNGDVNLHVLWIAVVIDRVETIFFTECTSNTPIFCLLKNGVSCRN